MSTQINTENFKVEAGEDYLYWFHVVCENDIWFLEGRETAEPGVYQVRWRIALYERDDDRTEPLAFLEEEYLWFDASSRAAQKLDREDRGMLSFLWRIQRNGPNDLSIFDNTERPGLLVKVGETLRRVGSFHTTQS